MKACPVCKKKNSRIFSKKNSFAYLICEACHTVFLSLMPSAYFLENLYNKKYAYRVDQVSHERMLSNSHAIIKELKKLHPKGRTLLDIGAGFGSFVKTAEKLGLVPIGIEPAKNLYLQARRNKAPLINLSLKQYFKANPEAQFDFIILMHVIEHVGDPIQFLTECLEHLAKDGILYMETPNVRSHLFWAEQENYTFLTPPDHTILFSPHSLAILVERSGATVERKVYFSFPEHVIPVLKRLFSIHTPPRKAQESTKKRHPSLKMGSNIKYQSINRLIAPLLTPFLNIGEKGSIMGFYIKRKQ